MTLYIACAFFVLWCWVALPGAWLQSWKLLRYFREEFLVVLGTSSTEPVMPRMLEKLQALGCKKAWWGWCCQRLLVQPRWHGDLPVAGCGVHCTGLQHRSEPDQTVTMLAIMLLSSKGAAGVTGSVLSRWPRR
jgi:Na+/H+-dicarboxylate symporter